MASDIDTELIELLKNVSINSDVKSKGWEYILGLTATEDGLNHIIQSGRYLPFILSFIQTDICEKEHANFAYKCLINISNQEKGAVALIDSKKDLYECLFNSICDEQQSSQFVQSKCYILSNLSAHSHLNEDITSILVSSKDLLGKLMKAYCSAESEKRKQYDFLTLVFANVSRSAVGRRFFLQDSNFMTSILAFLNASEPGIRRLGVSFILRNCCLETDYHEKLLINLNILPSILLPLMDGKVYEDEEMNDLPLECQYLDESKERDDDPSVRKILVQVLIALCYSENGWEYLQSKGVYYVLRDLHLWESDESVKDLVDSWVAYYLVENYSQPEKSAHSSEDGIIIEQLQSDMIRDLPDFIV